MLIFMQITVYELAFYLSKMPNVNSNKQEIFSSLIQLYCVYLLMCLTDFVDRKYYTSVGNQLIYAVIVLVMSAILYELWNLGSKILPYFKRYHNLI